MMLPMEKEPDTTAAAKARLVPPLKFAAVHCWGDRGLVRWDVLEGRFIGWIGGVEGDLRCREQEGERRRR